MRSREVILARIEEMENDPRRKYPPATVPVNALIALVQVGIDAEIKALKWVIEEQDDGKTDRH